MKTPKKLCACFTPDRTMLHHTLTNISWTVGDTILEGIVLSIGQDKIRVYIPVRGVDQHLRLVKAGSSFHVVCPNCNELKKTLYLPPYGRQFNCSGCWDIETGEGITIEKSPLANLLKKWLKVFK